MMLISTLRKLNAVVAILAVVLLGGCTAAEPTGMVSGKVTLEGEPVTEGVVSFFSDSGYSTTAEIQSDGSFSVTGEMPVDKYTVSVSPPELTDALPPGEVEIPKSPIPEGYFDESTSDIVQEIKEGENTLTIALKSSGPAGGAGPTEVAP